MTRIAIVALPFCHGSGVIGVMDFFAAANFCDRAANRTAPRFDCQIVTVDNQPVHSYSGIAIAPTVQWQDYPADVVIVGSAMEAVLGDRHIDTALSQSRPLHSWLQAAIDRSAIVASVCTGSFVLAEAGLLDQQVATTHWRAAPAFRRRYPTLRLESDQLLVDNGQIICAGGATSFVDLCLYLVERLGSPALAMACSKLLILDARRSEQTPYMSFYGSRAHQDEVIGDIQGWLEQHYADAIHIDDLAERAHLGPRTFKRRFKEATGETPLSYLQHLRIEAAKHGLESSRRQTAQIIWDVGYEDASSFRRLFKRNVGCTMEEYRRRFSYVTPRRSRPEPVSRIS
ncbi:MAG: helix-turn-helix domain-containing protein [Pseudomonadota bacterium]|nr:helix-turn-helix domain-containing protein [Pseudomonadota bacterium]